VIEETLYDPIGYRINRALAMGMGGDGKAAAESLKEYVDQHPDDDATKVVLATAMMLGGDPGWEPLLQNVLASSGDPSARRAAMDLIKYLLSLKQG
jgi:hypothetical protein